MWEGGTVFLIGGGPSLRNMDLRLLRSRRVIGTNSAYTLGDWVDVTLYGDNRWFTWNRDRLKDYKGLVVTCSTMEKFGPVPVKRLLRGIENGIEERPTHLAWNKNTGAAAINLAYHLTGPTGTAVLLGYDMKVDEKNGLNSGHNWHELHQVHHTPKKTIYEERFLPQFKHIATKARELGFTILNATPGSAIQQFPFVALGDLV